MKLLTQLSLALALTFPLTGFTANFAVVDSFAIMQRIGPNIDAKLHKEFKAKQEQLQSQQTALARRQEKLQRDGAIMSRNERNKLQRDIQLKQREVQRLTREINEDVAFRRTEELDKVTERVNQLIDKIEKEKKFDVILRKEAALFVDKQFDITPELLKRYQKAYPEKKS